MKRRDAILVASLDLFNRFGEANITSVDIADELDISPGNLYYHFRGKEEIVFHLAEAFCQHILNLTDTAAGGDETLAQRWPKLYLLLESCYRSRFLFRNLSDIVANYPQAGKHLVKTLASLDGRVQAALSFLMRAGHLRAGAEGTRLLSHLGRSIMLVVVYLDSYESLSGKARHETGFVASAALQILALLSPYLDARDMLAMQRIHERYVVDGKVRL